MTLKRSTWELASDPDIETYEIFSDFSLTVDGVYCDVNSSDAYQVAPMFVLKRDHEIDHHDDPRFCYLCGSSYAERGVVWSTVMNKQGPVWDDWHLYFDG